MNPVLRLTAAFAVGLSLATASPSVAAGPPTVRLQDLDSKQVDPFQLSRNARSIVFLFTSIDCPISNRYAPEIQRLHQRFASQGADFWLVYPNPAESGEAIRKHLAAFSYPIPALRDPQHLLAKLTKATVTPEAAVYDAERRLAYHGRIDNRYVNLGLERPSPTKRDLEEVLSAVMAGKPAPEASAPAVGCFIADFVQ
jgi:AhpC/TSA family